MLYIGKRYRHPFTKELGIHLQVMKNFEYASCLDGNSVRF